jgi:1,4-dihydroxy-2-naphthoate polyprenyltransferase
MVSFSEKRSKAEFPLPLRERAKVRGLPTESFRLRAVFRAADLRFVSHTHGGRGRPPSRRILPQAQLHFCIMAGILRRMIDEQECRQQTKKRPSKCVLLLAELRAPFLTGSVVPILLGTALAFHDTRLWNWPLFLWTLAGIVLIHSGANVANDFFDHLSGNDAANTDFIRPFTGGSRMIQHGLLSPTEVLLLSLTCFTAGSAIGLYLTFRVGLPILWIGLIGVAGSFFYTAPPVNLAARGLGEPIIALNFGILPVVGAYYVQTRQLSWNAALVALPVALLIMAILFINQFQDYHADKAVGKKNWVVRLGRARSVTVYAALMLLWTAPVVAGVLLNICPKVCLVALLPLPAAVKAIMVARIHFDTPRLLVPANGMTIAIHLAVGLLLSAGLLF